MRNRLALAVAIAFTLSVSGCANAPADFSDADRSDIRSAIESFTNAVKQNDYATAASWYAEDGVIMPPNAPAVVGRAGIQRALAGFGRIAAFSQPVIEVDGVGDLAYARLTYEATFTPVGMTAPITDKGKVLAVLKKQSDGKWRTIRAMHSSDLPAPGSSSR